ncbi:MAG TPA: alpha/beta fold hydrolase [Burkholderiaceae bacterium]|nr:alpha/beta fold hydrolase [Burkholderiaceae bacterium]
MGISAQAHGFSQEACRIKGITREVRCGKLERPQNPDEPDGRKIAIGYALIPALAKDKKPDPLFVLAGGPGQSATSLAQHFLAAQALLNTRRDLIFIDQRGTGRSNALACPAADPTEPLQQSLNMRRRFERLSACLQTLQAQGNDTRQYATWIAVQDLDAVRAALGAARINLWAASYGTRVALDYMRQYPQRVRAAVLDGVVPPHIVLPTSFALDNQAALTRLSEQCRQAPPCHVHYPDVQATVSTLLARAHKGQLRMKVVHPITGAAETLELDPMALSSAIRAALYLPVFATELPYALSQAQQGDGQALVTLMHTLGQSAGQMAEGMHFAVICAEDMPRLDSKSHAIDNHFSTSLINLYRRICPLIAVRKVPEAFFSLPDTPTPVLILSGGADPATPPHHGQTISQRLKNATHLIAPHLGHGVSSSGCAPRLIDQFINEPHTAELDASCLERIPAPSFFLMPGMRVP